MKALLLTPLVLVISSTPLEYRALIESSGKACLMAFWSSVSTVSVPIDRFSCRLVKQNGQWGLVGHYINDIPGTFQPLKERP